MVTFAQLRDARPAVWIGSGDERKTQDMLERLARAVTVTSVEDAENTDLRDAAQTEIALLAGTIPNGDPDRIAVWWSSLSRDDQRTLQLATPVQLEGLAGLP